MVPQFLTLPAFSCVGLARTDAIDHCRNWIPALWQEFMRRVPELASTGAVCQGVWGLMYDPEFPNAPWGGEQGVYLAGWQVASVVTVPTGWTVREVPEGTWLVVHSTVATIPQAVAQGQEFLRSHREWIWEGAVHERYPPAFRNPAVDEMELLFALLPR